MEVSEGKAKAIEDPESVYKTTYMKTDEEHRGKAINARHTILKADAKLNSSLKKDQTNKFEQKSKLQVDIYTNEHASLSTNAGKLALYYDEVRNTVNDYGDSIKLFEDELNELRIFSESKNEEITNMMPAEYDNFNLQVKNFFAKQQTQNFKMKKYAVKLTKEISELKTRLMAAVERVANLEKAVTGSHQSYGMNNEEIERRSFAGSIHEADRG